MVLKWYLNGGIIVVSCMNSNQSRCITTSNFTISLVYFSAFVLGNFIYLFSLCCFFFLHDIYQLAFFPVSEETVQGNLKAMEKQLDELETNIKVFKPSADNDRFKEVMSISFFCKTRIGRSLIPLYILTGSLCLLDAKICQPGVSLVRGYFKLTNMLCSKFAQYFCEYPRSPVPYHWY